VVGSSSIPRFDRVRLLDVTRWMIAGRLYGSLSFPYIDVIVISSPESMGSSSVDPAMAVSSTLYPTTSSIRSLDLMEAMWKAFRRL